MATLRIPTSLRTLTHDREEVQAAGATVGEVLANLEKSHPGFRERLLDDKGGVRRYVNIFCNDEDIRFLQGLQTQVQDSDRLLIVPAIAGGSEAC
jgi:molybdopterin converting factor small subunit